MHRGLGLSPKEGNSRHAASRSCRAQFNVFQQSSNTGIKTGGITSALWGCHQCTSENNRSSSNDQSGRAPKAIFLCSLNNVQFYFFSHVKDTAYDRFLNHIVSCCSPVIDFLWLHCSESSLHVLKHITWTYLLAWEFCTYCTRKNFKK